MSQWIMNLFGKPHGLLGRIGGRMMAASNKEINEWTVSLLKVKPDDRILEIGFGPGMAAELISDMIQQGKYTGIDISEVMLKQAQKRNAAAIRKGKVNLKLAPVEKLPAFHEPFDKVFSINSVIFWDNPIQRFKELRQCMKPDGMIAVTLQPRNKGATDETAQREGEKMVHLLEEAGFQKVRLKIKKMQPVSAACAIGSA